MSENEYQESYHFVTSHPEAVARQMTHLIVGKRELEVRVKQLEAALDRVMIGGNSLAQIIGADHPPYGTSYDEALAHYGPGHQYEAWCCWNAIMQARAALNPTTQQENTND